MHLPVYYEYGCRAKIVAGRQALEKLPALLQQWAAKRPMLITDKGVSAAGLIDRVTEALSPAMSLANVTDDLTADSDAVTVSRLALAFRESGCDSILALGGGAVMDTAKVVNIAVCQGADDGSRWAGAGSLKHPLKPLITIPTTAGSGSEVSPVGWAADRLRLVKKPLAGDLLLPHAAVLDPRLTLTLPPDRTAATAMEALTHAVEAYTGLAKNPISDAHAFSAIRLISENLLHVIQAPGDLNGRLNLAIAACLAGLALSNAMAGMVHALGNSVAALYRVSHGNCMAILLPYGLEYNMHKNGHLTAELLLPLVGAHAWAESPYHLRAERVVAVIRAFNQSLHELTGGLYPRSLKEIKDRDGRVLVPESALAGIAACARGDGAILCNPEEMDMDEALMVLRHAWEGIPLDSSRVRKA